MHFEGAYVSNTSSTYQPSDSNTYSLIVQQTAAPDWPAASLPTGYWQRPIEGQNREWSVIAGNWVGMPQKGSISTFDGSIGKFNPYSTAPNTAHIVWTLPILDGGIAGMPLNDEGFYSGDSYESKCFPAIIMNGIFYRNIPQTNAVSGNGFEAIDLRTGQILWKVPNGTISFGQLLMYDSANQHGVIPYLWSSSLQCFDAATGGFLLQFANVTSGTMVQDKRGNLLSYVLNYGQKRLSLWNSTQAILYDRPVGQPSGFGIGDPNYWRPFYGGTYNWNKGVMWNVTIPDLSSYGVTGNPSIARVNTYDDTIYARFTGPANETYPVGYIVDIGFSAVDGKMLWVQKRTAIDDVETGSEASASYTAGPGVFLVFKQETMQWHYYSTQTGVLMWKSDPYTNPWGTYHSTTGDGPGYCAYGKLFATAYDGTVHCFDLSNGTNLWNCFVGSSGTETPYGTWPFYGGFVIADNKVYVSSGEHSPNQPMYRGESLYCIDANTGKILWQVYGYDQDPIIADGYLVTLNSYDMQEYCFGKGLSAVTVSAPQTAVPTGTGILIQGTVTDQSPGKTCLGIPAAGTPAIADEYMSEWMEYLYMQKPKPTNATGVPVTILAIDSTGASQTIGSTVSDASGGYAITWSPTTAGLYTIVAQFDGTGAYYASSSETHVAVAASATPLTASDVASEVVNQLPTPIPATPVPTAPSASEVAAQVVSQLPLTNVIQVAAIAIAIIIGIINLVLLLKKKQV
jgi:hypothetical protein